MYKTYKRNIDLHKERPETGAVRTPQNGDSGDPYMADLSKLLLSGDLDVNIPVNSKVVRIFTSSTFTDTRNERNALMENVYPKLKQICKELGYEFQVVDMRWGVRDEATNDHTTTDLCLKEIHACRKLSTGPNFVTFLSHKYGYRPLQKVIAADEFSQIVPDLTKAEALLINRWYKYDNNMIPAAYVLQPISRNIPDFLASDRERHKAASKQWSEESTQLMKIIMNAASTRFSADIAHRYRMSVTEREITEGMLDASQNSSQCFWFHRIISDIDQQNITTANRGIISKYKDISDENQTQKCIEKHMEDLKRRKIPPVLPSKNIREYTIGWTDNGVDPINCEEHQHYIRKFCTDFESILKERIISAIQAAASTELSALHVEVLQHTRFCKERCSSFYGRSNELQEAKSQILANVNTPYVVHGGSGSGKTSLMAEIAHRLKIWIKKEIVLILRFIGTTPSSSTLRLLLQSVTRQIKTAYHIASSETNTDDTNIETAAEHFHEVLKQVSMLPSSEVCPLFLLFDSLDQLSNEDNPQALKWIPKQLPNNVYLVLSSLHDTDHYDYGYIPKLFSMLGKGNERRFLKVLGFPEEDAKNAITSWFLKVNRQVTSEQQELLMKTYAKCRLPLFLQLCFEEACKWSSYTRMEDITLVATVHGAINAVFNVMERRHGNLLVSRTFAYITASKNGLSETELEDILSCDDDVLNDVYQYWTPPIRRLPPLLLVRLKNDVTQYLAERESGGITIIYWYHRQFIETSRRRYLEGENITSEQRQQIHKNIAEYFLGKWANNEMKPFQNKNGTTDSKCRFVSAQPTVIKDSPLKAVIYNIRKLEELPIQLVLADMFSAFDKTVMLNLEWHLAKMKAFSYRALLDDIQFAFKHMSGKHVMDEWKDMRDALRLSEEALLYDIDLLPSQILARVTNGLENYRKQCRNYDGYALFASMPCLTAPRGELALCLAGHRGPMRFLQLTQNEKYAITGNEDMSIRVWDLSSGVEVLAIDNCFLEMTNPIFKNMLLCCDDKYIIAMTLRNMFVFDAKTGSFMYSRTDAFTASCAVFEGNTNLALEFPQQIKLLDVHQNTYDDKYINTNRLSSAGLHFVGSRNIVCTALQNEHYIDVYDVNTMKQLHHIEFTDHHETSEYEREYETSLLAVSPNAKMILVSRRGTSQNHMVCLYNTMTGQLIYHVKGSMKYCLLEGGFISNTLVAGWETTEHELMILNVESKKLTSMFKHPQFILKVVATGDLTSLITICNDPVLRVWQPRQEFLMDQDILEDKCSLKHGGVADQSSHIERVEHILTFTGSSRYILINMHIFTLSGDSHSCIKLHDVYDDVTIKTVHFSRLLYRIELISDKEALLCAGEPDERSAWPTEGRFRLYLFNFDALALGETLSGLYGSSIFYIRGDEQNKEVVCLNESRSRIQIVPLGFPGEISTIDCAQKEKLDSYFVISKDGSTAAFGTNPRHSLLVICLKAKTLRHQIVYKGLTDIEPVSTEITRDGRYLIHQLYHVEPPDNPFQFEWKTSFLVVWDLKRGKYLTTIYDKQATYQEVKLKRKAKKRLILNRIDKMLLLERNELKVATTNYDKMIKIFDARTGELQHTIRDRTNVQLLKAAQDTQTERGQYCFSITDAHITSIYDVDTWNRVACFKSDSPWGTNCVMVDNFTIAWIETSEELGKGSQIHVLRLHTGGRRSEPSTPPVMFTRNDTQANVDIPWLEDH